MKSDQVTVRQRVEEVMQLRLLGAELRDIRQYASEQTPPWDVSDRQLWRYIHASDDLIARTLEKDRTKLLNRHLAQRRVLYARAMAVSDYRIALAVLKDEGALLRLYEVMPNDPTATDTAAMKASDVVRILAGRLRQIERSDLSTGEKAKLTATLAGAFLNALSVDELETRLAALEAVMKNMEGQQQ